MGKAYCCHLLSPVSELQNSHVVASLFQRVAKFIDITFNRGFIFGINLLKISEIVRISHIASTYYKGTVITDNMRIHFDIFFFQCQLIADILRRKRHNRSNALLPVTHGIFGVNTKQDNLFAGSIGRYGNLPLTLFKGSEERIRINQNRLFSVQCLQFPGFGTQCQGDKIPDFRPEDQFIVYLPCIFAFRGNHRHNRFRLFQSQIDDRLEMLTDPFPHTAHVHIAQIIYCFFALTFHVSSENSKNRHTEKNKQNETAHQEFRCACIFKTFFLLIHQ